MTDIKRDLMDAYIFALPLVLFDSTMRQMTNVDVPKGSFAPIGRFGHSTKFADYSSKSVVTPNVDTLYSSAFVNLYKGAYILEKPATDRYCTFEIFDSYTNCIALLGTGVDGGNSAKKYLLSGPDYNGDIPDDVERIISPTSLIWIIGRTICSDNSDVAEMREIMDLHSKMTITPLSVDNVTAKKGLHIKENEISPIKNVSSMPLDTFFNKFNRLCETNPPSAEDEPFMKKIRYLGIGPGQVYEVGAVDRDTTNKLPKKALANITKNKGKYQKILNNWQYWDDKIAIFGTDYEYRALVAFSGLGANPVSMAMYPFREVDDDGAVLNGSNKYRLHLEKDQLPPCKKYGFWSFTVYGDDNFLINNEIKRYCINDRSDLEFNADGSLDILLQNEKPANVNNWLPTGNKVFHIVLRIYLPSDDAVSMKWMPPNVIRDK